MERYSAYDDLAWIYNNYWAQPLRFLLPLEQLILDGAPPDAHILDLCCGTGQLAAALTARGYRVTGVDGSNEMLRYARENAPQAELILGDARELDVSAMFDGAVSQYDSLNHVMDLAELQAVFRRVQTSLLPGARFLFDLNTEEGFQARWNDSSFGLAAEDHAYVARSTYDPEDRVGLFSVTMFFLRDGSWERSDVELHQRCYGVTEVCDALIDAGFETAQTYDVQEELGLDAPGRAFFVAEKGDR